MASDPRIRTRGLVVAALLSVASFSGAEKSANNNVRVGSDTALTREAEYDIDHNHSHNHNNNPDGTCKFVPNGVRSKKQSLGKDKSSPDMHGHPWGNSRKGVVKSKSIEDLSQHRILAQITLEGKAELESEYSDNEISPPALRRSVSWGENTYHETHAPHEYDRTSWPDPYDVGYDDSEDDDNIKQQILSTCRPFGLSLVVLYVAMLVALSIPS
mmetsp:Transcript_31778/g.44312  ORF Transcript_31778/g.44312 Transcript_31778/m.44312 type:complete len:214 (-) Transcript_31778:411-1052(-)|eukprot:CAMPEP_0185253424 /NCGR_PEP_ID=MMETSP1359-20130426/2183_1 /TAXON_ID=552665 /ORGANISM="Bigelowiella longifila, Strain CCMP242" /LENGTH=213 /DNA_ID=CAMNT_0027835803 /DNA_START=32 /DNA_END=673 /DNA_ORIENTATION=+